MTVKYKFELPIIREMTSIVEVIAESKEEAIEKFYEMDDHDMGYPFDHIYPSTHIDKSQEIQQWCLGGLAKVTFTSLEDIPNFMKVFDEEEMKND